MTEDYPVFEEPARPPRLRTIVLPLLALVVVVAIVSGLMLSGAVKGHEPRVGPEEAPTTLPTVEIVP